MRNKIKKYLLRGFLTLIALLIVLYIGIMIYVTINKKSIISRVTDEISQKINGKVTIGDVDISLFGSFPKMSVLLKNVTVTDSLYAQHHHELFKGEEIFAQLGIGKLIRKEMGITGIKIVNAGIYLYTDSTGYSNTYLLKAKQDTSGTQQKSAAKTDLQSVILKNVHLILNDQQKDKLYDLEVSKLNSKINSKDSLLLFSNSADILINDLGFNLANGSFAKGKKFEGEFDIFIDQNTHRLRADIISVKIGGQPFIITASFDLQGPEAQFMLSAKTKNISYALAKELLTEKIAKALSIANVDQKINASVLLEGPLKGGDPKIVANWEVKNSALQTKFLDFNKASFSGSYTNEIEKEKPRKDSNSKIDIQQFSGEWNGLPVTSQDIQIINLTKPLLIADLKSSFPLQKLNDLLGSEVLDMRSGDFNADLTYRGPLEKNNNTNSFLNGSINFSNGTFLYEPRNVEMKNVNGKIEISNSNVEVQNLQFTIAGSKITMKGVANNLITLAGTNPDKIHIQWNIFTPSLNLGSFLYLLSPPQARKSKKKKGSLGKFAHVIDDIFSRGSANVKLNTNQLIYKKFTASKVVADVSVLPSRYLVNKAQLSFGNGSLSLNGSLVSNGSQSHKGTVHSIIQNVDVAQLFRAFDNFGQKGIGSQNLRGNLSADVNANFGLNNSGEILPNSVSSTVNFSLKNGALVQFEPVMKIQDYVFKKRDFSDIRFADLSNKLIIQNNKINIPRMEIASSVINFFVEGVYGTNGGTDVSVQIPLSNLKKKDQTNTPIKLGTDSKVGSSLYLRGQTGNDGNVHFSTDLFKRFKKDKGKGNQ